MKLAKIRPAIALLLIGAPPFGLPAPSRAYEVAGTSALSSGLRIYAADEVLARFCVQQGERLILTLPGGASFELITRVDDPAIVNQGDGSFHPIPRAEVEAAFADVSYPMGGVSADVFILPYPRRAGLESAAGPGVILLSPGVREVPREQVHAEVAHELGHVIQYALMPDRDQPAWDRYRQLRGITDPNVYNAWGDHANRPHEIFAEDFRSLFGGDLANYSGTLENPALAPPSTVGGLRDFITGLSGQPAGAALAASAYPNPARGAMTLAFPAAPGSDELGIYDVAGRLVRTLRPRGLQGGRYEFAWDGRNEDGRPVAAGAYLARPRRGGGAVLRVVALPPR